MNTKMIIRLFLLSYWMLPAKTLLANPLSRTVSSLLKTATAQAAMAAVREQTNPAVLAREAARVALERDAIGIQTAEADGKTEVTDEAADESPTSLEKISQDINSLLQERKPIPPKLLNEYLRHLRCAVSDTQEEPTVDPEDSLTALIRVYIEEKRPVPQNIALLFYRALQNSSESTFTEKQYVSTAQVLAAMAQNQPSNPEEEPIKENIYDRTPACVGNAAKSNPYKAIAQKNLMKAGLAFAKADNAVQQYQADHPHSIVLTPEYTQLLARRAQCSADLRKASAEAQSEIAREEKTTAS